MKAYPISDKLSTLTRSQGKSQNGVNYPDERRNESPKSNSVRHTRAIQRDRSKQPLREAPAEEIETLLDQLVTPIVGDND